MDADQVASTQGGKTMKNLSAIKKTTRALIAGTMAASVALISTNAMADPVMWEFEGAKINDTLVASGSFIYDADTNIFSDIDISANDSFGLDLTNTTYSILSPTEPASATDWAFVDALTGPNRTGEKSIRFSTNGAQLTNAGGTIDNTRVPSSPTMLFVSLGKCLNSGCTSYQSSNFGGTQNSGGGVINQDTAVLTGTPIIIDEDGDGVLDTADLCPGTVIPEAAPTSGALGANRYALTVEDVLTFATGKKGKDTFTTEDTGGCSCEQIAEAGFLGNGHMKHGCSVGEMRSWVNFVAAQ